MVFLLIQADGKPVLAPRCEMMRTKLLLTTYITHILILVLMSFLNFLLLYNTKAHPHEYEVSRGWCLFCEE